MFVARSPADATPITEDAVQRWLAQAAQLRVQLTLRLLHRQLAARPDRLLHFKLIGHRRRFPACSDAGPSRIGTSLRRALAGGDRPLTLPRAPRFVQYVRRPIRRRFRRYACTNIKQYRMDGKDVICDRCEVSRRAVSVAAPLGREQETLHRRHPRDIPRPERRHPLVALRAAAVGWRIMLVDGRAPGFVRHLALPFDPQAGDGAQVRADLSFKSFTLHSLKLTRSTLQVKKRLLSIYHQTRESDMASDNFSSYTKWCNAVEAHANKTTNGLINFKNVEFNWAERMGDPVASTADQLVVAAQKQIAEMFIQPLFRECGASRPSQAA